MKRLTLRKMKNRERILEEFKFMDRFEPLTLEQAKVICDTLEECLARYPFLRKKLSGQGLYKKFYLRKRLRDQDDCCPRSWSLHCSRFRQRGEFKASGVRGRNNE